MLNSYSSASEYVRYNYQLSQGILFLQQVFLLGQLDIFDPIRLMIETSFSSLTESTNHLGHEINMLCESIYHRVRQYVPDNDIDVLKHLSITMNDYNNDDRSSNVKGNQQNEFKLGPTLFATLTIELHHIWPLSGIIFFKFFFLRL